jgi:hypothetical protein
MLRELRTCNLFAGVPTYYLFLPSSSFTHILFTMLPVNTVLQDTKMCTRCKKLFPQEAFAGKNGDIKASCTSCRDSKVVYRAGLLDDRKKAKEDTFEEIDMLELPGVIESAVNEALYIEGGAVCFSVQFTMPEEWLSLEVKQIVEDILDIVETSDTGYKFNVSRVNPSKITAKATFIAYCSLSSIHAKEKNTGTKRVSASWTRYDCGGFIKGVVDMEGSVIRLSYKHDVLHEHPKQSDKSEPEVIAHVQALALEKDITAVRKDVRNRFPNTLMTPKQIYYWYQVATRHLHVRDEDQIESSRKLVEEYGPKGFQIVRISVSWNSMATFWTVFTNVLIFI